jgi:hypothetical protein
MTFYSYRKTQRKDQQWKKFCKCWKNQSTTISTCYQKGLDPIPRRHDLYTYYMIKSYLYTIYHNQLYTMKSI